MTNKPFIHPEILLKIKLSTGTLEERIDQQTDSNAQTNGQEFADRVIKQMFSVPEYGAIESHFNTERLSSSRFSNFRSQIVNIHHQRKRFDQEIADWTKRKNEINTELDRRSHSLFRFFYKKKIAALEEQLQIVNEKINILIFANTESYIQLTYQFENLNIKADYSDLFSSFTTMHTSRVIWDVLTNQINLETKAAASTLIDRKEVKLDFKGIAIIQTEEYIMHWENSNGGDFFFYPHFIIYYKNRDEVAVIDYRDLQIHYQEQHFLETAKDTPSDTTVAGETWYRVNKDGSPDRRFTGNYKIPVVLYGALQFKSTSGINELYYISDHKKAKHFWEQYQRYQELERKTYYDI